MRSTKILIGVCAVLIMAAGSTTSLLGQQQAPGAPGGVKNQDKAAGAPTGVKPVKPSRTKGVPLSTNECIGLGGELISASIAKCLKGQACRTKRRLVGACSVHYQARLIWVRIK